MRLEQTVDAECLATVDALVRPVTRVDALVHPQIVLPREALTAQRTREVELLVVDGSMLLQVALPGKAFTARAAHKGLLSRASHLMFTVVVPPSQHLATELAQVARAVGVHVALVSIIALPAAQQQSAHLTLGFLLQTCCPLSAVGLLVSLKLAGECV